MSEAEMKARIAELEARLAQSQEMKLKLTDAGYIDLRGVPGKGMYSISNTPEGWEAIFKAKDQIMAFVNANRAVSKLKLDAYRANKKAKAAAIG